MELVDLEMYIEELLGWMLNIIDTVVVGRVDSCSSCGGACGSDDIAIYHTISATVSQFIQSIPHDLQKMM